MIITKIAYILKKEIIIFDNHISIMYYDFNTNAWGLCPTLVFAKNIAEKKMQEEEKFKCNSKMRIIELEIKFDK